METTIASLQCTITKKNGRWGFWCDAFDEEAMLGQVEDTGRVVGKFLDATEGVVTMIALADTRKEVVQQLPKTKTFFELPSVPEQIAEGDEVIWVGHIRCFPYNPQVQQQMLSEGYAADSMIVVFRLSDGNMGASSVKIEEKMLVPQTTCCD